MFRCEEKLFQGNQVWTNGDEINGYDTDLPREVSQSVSIPAVALGGAGSSNDLVKVYDEGFANRLAAGSIFVYHDSNKRVLINYTEIEEVQFQRHI